MTSLNIQTNVNENFLSSFINMLLSLDPNAKIDMTKSIEKANKKEFEIENILKLAGTLDGCVDSQKSVKQLRDEKMKNIGKI